MGFLNILFFYYFHFNFIFDLLIILSKILFFSYLKFFILIHYINYLMKIFVHYAFFNLFISNHKFLIIFNHFKINFL